MTRPDRDLIRALVFDEQWRIRREAKKKCERITCTRRSHTIGIAVRTPYGWWVAWRVPQDRHHTDPWEYDWADQVTGYTEATCHCGRSRRVDPWFGRLPAAVL